VVLKCLFLTLTLGKVWAIATALAYVLLNVPNLWKTVKGWVSKEDEK
jgi:hypothetical protein